MDHELTVTILGGLGIVAATVALIFIFWLWSRD